MMRNKSLLFYVVLSIAGAVQTAPACVCSSQDLNDREAAAAQFAEAAVVFEGEVVPGGHEVVTPSRDKPGLSLIMFRVIRSYKGGHDELIQVYDSMAGTDCAFGQPAPGEKYFVYGFRGTDGKIYVQACTRTTTLDFAGPDLRYARGEPPKKEDLVPPGEKWRLQMDSSLATSGATLRGSVRHFDAGDVGNIFLAVWDLDEQGRRKNSMAATQKVNADGSYEVRFLAAGHYLVTAEDSRMTPTTRFVGEYGTVTLVQGQVMGAVDIVLRPEPLGKVTVQVDAPPELHDRVFVWLRDAEMDSIGSAPYHYAQTAHLDNKNMASFEYVPYGRYDVYVMLDGEDLTKPSWTHDEVQVELNGNHAGTVVALHRNKPE